MKLKRLSLIGLAVTIIAACGAPGAPPTQLPVPASTPFVSPIDQPISPIATPPITRPNAEQWANAPAAALSARQALVEQLKIDPDTIGLASFEHVDWPDACLGVQTPGVACAQIIVTGYRVVLAAQGNLYEYHTDETGRAVKFAAQSVP